eukprot:848268-Lingulodinium_polyedra.AAC.1
MAPEFAKGIAQEFCFAIGFSPQASRLRRFITSRFGLLTSGFVSGFSPRPPRLRHSIDVA